MAILAFLMPMARSDLIATLYQWMYIRKTGDIWLNFMVQTVFANNLQCYTPTSNQQYSNFANFRFRNVVFEQTFRTMRVTQENVYTYARICHYLH